MASDLLKATAHAAKLLLWAGIIVAVTYAVFWVSNGSLWGLFAYLVMIAFVFGYAAVRADKVADQVRRAPINHAPYPKEKK